MSSHSKWLLTLFLLSTTFFAHARKLAPEIIKAMGEGAMAKFVLKVCDDEGAPVSNAIVRVEFDLLPNPHSVYGKTDSNGICVVEGKTNGNKVKFTIRKDGYYGSCKEITYIEMGREHEVKNDKWLPYGDEVSLSIKPIKNPITLRPLPGRGDYKHTDAVGEWVGYDLDVDDFVNPFGTGLLADFEVYLDWDGKSFPKCERLGMKVRFTEDYSGYYELPLDTESEFKTPYSAMTNVVFSQVATYYYLMDGKRLRNKFDRSKCWIIRSRCTIDDQGRLQKANYSVARYIGVSGGVNGKAGFIFCGAFNPTPNDTNLEDADTARLSRLGYKQHLESELLRKAGVK